MSNLVSTILRLHHPSPGTLTLAPPSMEILPIPDLLNYLQSHPHPANFNVAAGIFQSRHDSLLVDLTIKEVDLVELRFRCNSLELQLQESLTKAEDARKRAQTAEDKLDFFIQAHKDLYPDNIIQVSDSEDDAAAAAAVVDAGVITHEDGDDGRAHLLTPLPRFKSPFVFYSDSEDEGGGVIILEDGDDCEGEDVVCHLRQMIAEAKDTEGSSVPKSGRKRRKAKRSRSIMRSKGIKRSMSGIKRSLSSKR